MKVAAMNGCIPLFKKRLINQRGVGHWATIDSALDHEVMF